MKRLLYTFLFIQAYALYGQRGYYIKDSLASYGVELVDGGAIQNSKQCQVKDKKKNIIYSPQEVKEYGFIKDKVYLSRIINLKSGPKRVFLERLRKGKISLYYYKDKEGSKFFLEKDSGQIVEIIKNNDTINYKKELEPYIKDCNNVYDALKLVSYSKLSLSKFINQYNECERKPFPYSKFGLTIGYSCTKLTSKKISDEILKNAVFEQDNTFNIGAFIDIPILPSYFSLHPEVYFQKNGFSSYVESNNSVNDIIINFTSVNLAILIKYTYPSLKIRPYINGGGIFSYNFKNENAVYTTTISNDNIVAIDKNNFKTIYPQKQVGFMLGVGIQCNIDYRRSTFLELRYNKLYTSDEETFSNRGIQLVVGLSF